MFNKFQYRRVIYGILISTLILQEILNSMEGYFVAYLPQISILPQSRLMLSPYPNSITILYRKSGLLSQLLGVVWNFLAIPSCCAIKNLHSRKQYFSRKFLSILEETKISEESAIDLRYLYLALIKLQTGKRLHILVELRSVDKHQTWADLSFELLSSTVTHNEMCNKTVKKAKQLSHAS